MAGRDTWAPPLRCYLPAGVPCPQRRSAKFEGPRGGGGEIQGEEGKKKKEEEEEEEVVLPRLRPPPSIVAPAALTADGAEWDPRWGEKYGGGTGEGSQAERRQGARVCVCAENAGRLLLAGAVLRFVRPRSILWSQRSAAAVGSVLLCIRSRWVRGLPGGIRAVLGSRRDVQNHWVIYGFTCKKESL